MLPEEAARFRIVHAIRDALPTHLHAEMLFEQVADLMGSAAWVERAGGGSRLKLFRRDAGAAERVAPWPLLELDLRGRLDFVETLEGEPIDIPTREGKAPKLRGLGPGQLNMHVGGEAVTLVYGGDGRCSEVVNPRKPEKFAGAEAALALKTGSPVELLAAFVASVPLNSRNAGRLFVPAPFPQGVEWLWFLGRRHIGRAVFENRIPEDCHFAAADALCGDAAAGGDTRESALAACLAEVHRVRPWLPRAEAPLAMTAEEAAAIGARVYHTAPGDAPLPPRDPANVPIAVASFIRNPGENAKIGEWRRLASCRGIGNWHIFRQEAGGWTLFGHRLWARFGSTWLFRATADADAAIGPEPPPPPPWPDAAPPLRVAVRTYRIPQPGWPQSSTLVAEDSWAHELQPWDLDDEVARTRVIRMRWIKE